MFSLSAVFVSAFFMLCAWAFGLVPDWPPLVATCVVFLFVCEFDGMCMSLLLLPLVAIGVVLDLLVFLMLCA